LHCSIYPIYGTSQGSANSLALWTIVCSTLFNAHEEAAHGSTYESPDRTVSIQLHMVGFVDDTSGSVNEFLSNTPPTPERLIQLMHQDAQLWSDLLHSSGGALELSKCSYHVIYYNFALSGVPVLQGGQIGPDINIVSGDHTSSHKFKPLAAFTSHKTLGVHKEPAGHQRSSLPAITKNSTTKSSIVAQSSLNRHES
jgi:hypothetical protein